MFYPIDKVLNPTCEIMQPLSDGDGYTWTPDTSVTIDIYPANSDTQIVTGAAMSVKDSETGVYFYTLNASALNVGFYIYKIKAVDSGNNYSDDGVILITENNFIGIDRAVDSTIELTANWHDANGIDAAPNTSITISVYNGRGTKQVSAQVMSVKDSVTGFYKYALDISDYSDGTYNYLSKAVNSGETNYRHGIFTLKKGRAQTSVNGDIRFFDTNLIESSTASEPDLTTLDTLLGIARGGATDIRENFLDNRSETKVTLKPIFSDADLIDKDMEAIHAADPSLGWVGTNTTVTADGATKIIGSFSIKCDSIANATTANMNRTFTAFDIADEQIGWVAFYFDDAVPTNVQLEIKDSAGISVKITATTDYLGAAFTIDSWNYIAFDLSGDGTIDYTDIDDVTVYIYNNTGGAITNIYVDGLRFNPHEHVFEYVWSADETVNLVEIKGCNSKTYNISYDTGYVAWGAGAFTSSVDYALVYDETGKTGDRVRIKLHVTDFNGNFEIDIEDLLVLKLLGRGGFTNDGKIKPILNNEIKRMPNWVGANHVFKPKTMFACNIEFDGFPATETEGQDDSDYVTTLFDRSTPFYIWLNGDRGNSGWANLKEVFKEQNLYLVQDISQNKQGHQGDEDYTNGGEKYILKLIEAAWVEAE